MPTTSGSLKFALSSTKNLVSATLLIVLLLWIAPKPEFANQDSIILEAATQLNPDDGIEIIVPSSSNTTLDRRMPARPFTNGPHFVGFPDANTENMARAAFLDIYLLALAGMQAVCSRSPEYHHYFDDQDWQTVFNLFKSLYNDGAGPPPMNQPAPLTLPVAYGDQLRFGSKYNLCGPNSVTYAWMLDYRPDGEGSALTICPNTFLRYPASLARLTCGMFKASLWIKEELKSIEVIIVHEMMHYGPFSMKYGGLMIDDYGHANGKFSNLPGIPFDGYGAYQSQQLKINRGQDPKVPTRNADSYANMAMEAYWAQKCGISFELVPAALAPIRPAPNAKPPDANMPGAQP